MERFGIDVSQWQGDFDWSAALAEGVQFAILKGGGGDDGLYRDPKFDRNYREAKARNLPVGCYWFSRALSVEEAEREADYFYTQCLQGRQFELPIYMDVEHRAQLNLGKEKLTEIVRVFCDRLEQKRFGVGIYASLNTFSEHLLDEKLQSYAHWVAQWATALTYPGREGVCGMWQFGGSQNYLRSTRIAGVVCDQDYLLIDYESSIKSAGLNGFASAPLPTEDFLPEKGYFGPGDNSPKVGMIASFLRRVFPAYTDERALGNYYGPYLTDSVREFQRRTGLVSDGYVGPLTLAELEKYGFSY